MDKKEFATFAAAMKTYYPKENLLPNNQAMELWYRQLNDIPYEIAEATLNQWVAVNKWSPTIAEIRQQAAEIKVGAIPDWADGWEQVLKAIRLYGSYRPAEAMAMLDGITKQVVERIGFMNLCMTENISIERASFRDIYNQIANRRIKEAQTPIFTKSLIAEIRRREALQIEEKAE